MSYSFAFAAPSKDAAKQKIVAEFESIVASQPTHAKDRDQAVAVGCAFVDLLEEPKEGHEIHVTMHGSLSWRHVQPATPEPVLFTGGGVSVSTHIRAVK